MHTQVVPGHDDVVVGLGGRRIGRERRQNREVDRLSRVDRHAANLRSGQVVRAGLNERLSRDSSDA